MYTKDPTTFKITSLPFPYWPRKPFDVQIRVYGDSYVATFEEANISTSGDTVNEAIRNIKDIIVTTFIVLTCEKEHLGIEPNKCLAALQKVVKYQELPNPWTMPTLVGKSLSLILLFLPVLVSLRCAPLSIAVRYEWTIIPLLGWALLGVAWCWFPITFLLFKLFLNHKLQFQDFYRSNLTMENILKAGR